MQMRCVKNEKLIPHLGKDDGKVVLCACFLLDDGACLYRDCEEVGFDVTRTLKLATDMATKVEKSGDGSVIFNIADPTRIVPSRPFNAERSFQKARDRIKERDRLEVREEVRSIVAEVNALIESPASALRTNAAIPRAVDHYMYNGSDTTNALKDHLKTGSALQSQAGIPEVLRAEARAILNPTPEPIGTKASKTVLAATKLYREYVFMREVPLRNLDDPTKEPWVDDLHRKVKGVENAE